ncbi:MAG: hypothetical protein Kow0096_06610 [Thiohalomonadaceae bacterium]
MMHDNEFGPNFWLGNAVLALALVMLLFMGSLWESLGAMAMVVWTAVVALGVYLVMTKPPR